MSTRILRAMLSVTTLAGLLCSSSLSAAPSWNPADEDSSSEAPSLRLKRAAVLLYLDANCNKLALVAPSDRDIASYLPDPKEIAWHERLKVLPNPAGCADPSRTWNPMTPDIVDATVCDPLQPSTQEKRNAAWCGLSSESVKFLQILDKDFKPLMILTGNSAKAAVPSEIPARAVIKKTVGSLPCSPVTPSPCLLPKKATEVPLGGGKTGCYCL